MIDDCIKLLVRYKKFIFVFFLTVAILVLISICCAHCLVYSTGNRVYTDIDTCPEKKICVILGSGPYVRGRLSPTLQARLYAGAELYHARKIKYIFLSGAADSDKFYFETTFMRKALVAMGIPDSDIIEDNLGVRTLDSILRLKNVYHQDDFIVVSQFSHVVRALYLADHQNIKCIAFAACNPSCTPDFDVAGIIRISLANVKAVLDTVLHRSARYSYDTQQTVSL